MPSPNTRRRAVGAQTYESLRAEARPQNSKLPEALPYVLYDTVQYPQAGLSGALNFFNTVRTDQTLGNMEQAGQLPAGQLFRVQTIHCDILSAPSSNGASDQTGAANDVALILNSARCTLTWTIRSKSLGPIPLSFFGRSGAADAVIAGSLTAPDLVSFGATDKNGGFNVGGRIMIPDVTAFGVQLNGVASVAISAATYIRISMRGTLYRPVS